MDLISSLLDPITNKILIVGIHKVMGIGILTKEYIEFTPTHVSTCMSTLHVFFVIKEPPSKVLKTCVTNSFNMRYFCDVIVPALFTEKEGLSNKCELRYRPLEKQERSVMFEKVPKSVMVSK